MGLINAIRCFQRQFKKKQQTRGEIPSTLVFFSTNQSRSKAHKVGNDDPTISPGKGLSSIQSEHVEPSSYASFSEARQAEWSHPHERMAMTETEDMIALFENVNTVIRSLPFHCEVAVEIDRSVPREILTNNLLLFPSILHMLTHCISQSRLNTAQETNKSALHICCRQHMQGRNELIVRCQQAGPATDVDRAKELFADADSLLGQVAIMVRSLGGHWGMYHGTWNAELTTSKTQSLYWFRIPYDLVSYRNPLLENDQKEIHPAVGMTDIASPREEFLESFKMEASTVER
jgi:hypothetical protein